jgi:hypothetical protein
MPRGIVRIIRSKCGSIEYLEVAIVATRIESAVGHRILDRTCIFMMMRAVRITAMGCKGPEVSK